MNMQSAVTVKTVEFRQATCKKQRQRHLPKKPKRQIRPAAKKTRATLLKKRRKQNQKGAQRAGSSSYRQPQKRAAAEASPKASDRVKSPAQNQKRRPDEKQLTRKQFGFRKIPKRKSRKESLHPNKLLKNQLRTKINGTVTSHRNKSAQNGRKLLKKAMMICLQQEFLILTK